MGAPRQAGSIVAAAVACLALFAGTAEAKPLPNLKLTKLSNPQSSAEAGDQIAIANTVKNSGKKTAKASTTRFYLSFDKKKASGDTRLVGPQSISKLKPGVKAHANASVGIPASIADDDYFLIGCADDTGKVHESNEGDNCRSSTTKVAISAPQPVATTPYEINDGTVPAGTLVSLSGLEVTAVGAGGVFWVQVPGGPVANSGLEVHVSFSPPALQLGDRVDLTGTSHAPGPSTPGLTASSVVQTGTGVVDAPFVLSPSDLTNSLAAYNALLAEAQNVTVGSHQAGSWLMSEGFTVGNRIIGTLPVVADGAPISSVTGILDTTGSSLTLSPRGSADVTLPPLLQSFTNIPVGHSCAYGFGDVGVPVAQVTFSTPADGDTFVVVQSTNPGAVTINSGGVTVPDGQSSAPVIGNKVGAGTTTLTATLGSTQLSNDLTIRGPAEPLSPASLALAADTIGAGEDVLATLTMDCEAPPGGTTVLLTSNSAHAAVPVSVFVPAGQYSATFLAHGVSAGQATISATFNSVTVQQVLTVN